MLTDLETCKELNFSYMFLYWLVESVNFPRDKFISCEISLRQLVVKMHGKLNETNV